MRKAYYNLYSGHKLEKQTILRNKFKILFIGLLCGLFLLFSFKLVNAATTTIVTGDTSSGENQPGWLFNRDASTSTPFEFNSDAPSIGTGSLYVKPIGSNPADKMVAENFLATNVSDVNSVSYDFKIGSGGDATDKVHFYMNVYANFGSSSPTKFYDCRYNVVPTVGSTAGFTTVTFDPNQSYPVAKHGTSPYNCPASPAAMNIDSPGSKIRMFSLNVGDTTASDTGLDGYLDNVKVNTISADTIYDFEPVPTPTVAACSVTTGVHTTDLAAWDLSQTRATGHNALVADGLHIWTEGTTSTDKAAGYYATDFPLSGLGDQTIAGSIEYVSTMGITPGLQLVTDFDNNGTVDGILVGESVYGNNWWLTGSSAQFVKDDAPNNGGGNGSQWYGSPNEWLSKFPDANVKNIGYSLGSGVHGDGVIKKITLGCVEYTFERVVPAPTLVYPANNSTINASSPIANDWEDVADADSYIYQSYNVNSGGSCNLSDIRFTGSYTASETNSRSIADDLTFCWRVKAVAGGVESEWSELWKVTIDNTAPDAPVHQTPVNNAFINFNDFYFEWTDVSGAVEYEFQSATSPATDGNGALTTGVWNNKAHGGPDRNYLTSSNIHSYGANGAWYWQVRAIDAAGNKSGWTTPWKVTIDMVTPGVPTAAFTATPSGTSVSNGGFTQEEHFTFNLGSASDVVRYQLKYWNDITGSSFKAGSPWNPTDLSGYSSGLGVYNDRFTQGEGVHYFAFSACDAAGNCSSYGSPFVVTYDKTAPASPAHVSPADEAVRTTAAQTLIDWDDVSDPAGPITYKYESSAFSATNPDGSFMSPVYTSGVLSSSEIPTPGTPEGTYFWHVKAIDAAGNESGWSSAWKVVIDNTDPTVSIDTYTANGNVITPDVTATDANEPLTYAWTANDTDSANNVDISDPSVLEPDFTVNVDGSYSFTLTVTDAAGNQTVRTFEFTYATPPEDSVGPGAGPDTNSFVGGQGAAGAAGGFSTVTTGTPGGTPQVLAVNTNDTDNTTSAQNEDDNNEEDGNVQADSAGVSSASTTGNNSFAFSWWWLIILAAVLAFLYGLYRRRSNQSEE